MSRVVPRLLALLLLAAAIGYCAELFVTVQDTAGAPIPGLPVSISGPNEMSRRVVTDEQGLATFTELGAGRYTVGTHMEEAYGPAEEGEVRLMDAGAEVELRGQQGLSLILTSSGDFSTYCKHYWPHCSGALAGEGSAVLLGTLMRNGTPMRGALMCLERTAFRSCVEVDELGAYGLHFDPGSYSLGVYEGEAKEPTVFVERDFFEANVYFNPVSLPNSSDTGMVLGSVSSEVEPATCSGSALSAAPGGERVDASVDPDSELRFYNLQPGDYQIRLECEGHPPGVYGPVHVGPRSAESYSLVLPKTSEQ